MHVHKVHTAFRHIEVISPPDSAENGGQDLALYARADAEKIVHRRRDGNEVLAATRKDGRPEIHRH